MSQALFESRDQIQSWYDESMLGEREIALKPAMVVSNDALEKWFDDLDKEEQEIIFKTLLGKPIPTPQ